MYVCCMSLQQPCTLPFCTSEIYIILCFFLKVQNRTKNEDNFHMLKKSDKNSDYTKNTVFENALEFPTYFDVFKNIKNKSSNENDLTLGCHFSKPSKKHWFSCIFWNWRTESPFQPLCLVYSIAFFVHTHAIWFLHCHNWWWYGYLPASRVARTRLFLQMGRSLLLKGQKLLQNLLSCKSASKLVDWYDSEVEIFRKR